tara:strand:+ start:2711 stop:3781 length:1071 start_codon:yes stop_codon:yes gene_type:complete
MLRNIQTQAIKSWEKIKNGVIVMPTGAGKSFVGIQAITYIKKNDPNILFLAETRAREKTLTEEIVKYNNIFGTNIKMPQFMCYQSAYKLKGKHFDLVIADEIHDSITEKYSKFYVNNTWENLIGLTATPRLDKELSGDFYSKIPIIFGATVQDAVEAGDILDFNLHVMEHHLDDKDKYIEAGNKIRKFLTTEHAHYKFLTNVLTKSYYTNKIGLSKLFASKRATLMYNLKSKKEIVKKLIDNNPDKKIIIFGNSLNFLEDVCDHVVKGSDLKTLKYIDDFNEGKIRVIGSFKMLEQGVNLSGVNMAIIASYFSVKGKFIQRIGRVLRKDSDKPNIYVIKTMDTIEEKWFEKMINNE